jgi:hypothetical protein
MPVAAGISAGASVIGGLGSAWLQSNAAKNAANTYSAFGKQALDQQLAMFNTAKGALSPFITSGTNLLPTLSSLLTPGASQTDTLKNLPGFQFQSEWGGLSASNALAARGLGGSTGPLSKAISDYNQGLAGTSFNNLVQQILGGVNVGTTAAGALAGNATQTGAAMGSTLSNIGQAQAQGITGSAGAWGSGLTGAAGGIGNAALLSALIKPGSSSSIYGPAVDPWPSA